MRTINQSDFFEKLRAFDITVSQACELIHQKTGAVIHSKHVSTQLDRAGRLTETQCAVFGFLFRELEELYHGGRHSKH